MGECSKSEFLAKVSQAVAKKTKKAPNPESHLGPQIKRHQNLDAPALRQVFADQETDRHFVWRACRGAELAGVLQDIVAETGARRLAAASDEDSLRFGVADILRPLGTSLFVWPGNDLLDEKERTEALAEADLGVTVAQIGVAEIGTVIEWSTPQAGKSVSLLPSVHVALLPQSRLVPNLHEAMRFMQARFGRDRMPAGVVHISGPSSTGDIESVIVVGAHGPVAEHVVCLIDA